MLLARRDRDPAGVLTQCGAALPRGLLHWAQLRCRGLWLKLSGLSGYEAAAAGVGRSPPHSPDSLC